MKRNTACITDVYGLAKIMDCHYWDFALGNGKTVTGVLDSVQGAIFNGISIAETINLEITTPEGKHRTLSLADVESIVPSTVEMPELLYREYLRSDLPTCSVLDETGRTDFIMKAELKEIDDELYGDIDGCDEDDEDDEDE